MNEPLAYGFALVVAAMSAVTMFNRFAGYWMLGRVTVTPRIRRMLEALPGSVVAALVVPVMIKEGWPATLAMGAVALLMLWRRNEFLALAGGIAVAAALRAFGG